jgi:hypothetical protein
LLVAALGGGDEDRRVASVADGRQTASPAEAKQHQVQHDQDHGFGVDGRDGSAVGDDQTARLCSIRGGATLQDAVRP